MHVYKTEQQHIQCIILCSIQQIRIKIIVTKFIGKNGESLDYHVDIV